MLTHVLLISDSFWVGYMHTGTLLVLWIMATTLFKHPNVVSGHCRVVLIFNAAAMLYNAHTICVILRVNMQHFPKGAPKEGEEEKWGGSNSHSHHLFRRYMLLMVSRGLIRWQGDVVCDSQRTLGVKNGHLGHH